MSHTHSRYPGSLCMIDSWDSPRQGLAGLFLQDMLWSLSLMFNPLCVCLWEKRSPLHKAPSREAQLGHSHFWEPHCGHQRVPIFRMHLLTTPEPRQELGPCSFFPMDCCCPPHRPA